MCIRASLIKLTQTHWNLTNQTNIWEFLIIHCLHNTALKKTMHHLYIPCPPLTPSTQAGADRLLIQCLQSVHLEVHLGVHHENLQHMYMTRPPTTSWEVGTGANNIPPIVVYLLSIMKSASPIYTMLPWPPSTPRVLMQCRNSVHLEVTLEVTLDVPDEHSALWLSITDHLWSIIRGTGSNRHDIHTFYIKTDFYHRQTVTCILWLLELLLHS